MASVAATCGCFDIIHDAHINLFRAMRRMGDQVVVFLNSDESVSRLKGADKPTLPFDVRAKVLQAIRHIDAVIPFSEDTPAEAIRNYVHKKGDLTGDFFWVKGADARITGLPDDEKQAVWECGGMILYFHNPSDTHSDEIKGHIARTHKEADSEDMV